MTYKQNFVVPNPVLTYKSKTNRCLKHIFDRSKVLLKMDEQSLPNNHVLFSFAPRLRQNIKELLTGGKIGISSMNMKIHINPAKVSTNDNRETYTDAFIVEIPFAGKQLYWKVIFNGEDYDYAPDFEFCIRFSRDQFLYVPDIQFLCDPDINTISDYLPSLANWNIDNPKSLINVIKELMALYKNFQIAGLQNENRFAQLYVEYERLQPELENSENNVEVFTDHKGTVHFLVGINVNFSDLPPYIQPILIGKSDRLLNPNEDTATLSISFVEPYSSKVLSELQLSPKLEQVIGNSSALHIPAYTKDGGLINYIADVNKLLQERVDQIACHYRLRNEYINCLLTLCGYSIIEYDNILFTKANFLCEVDNFYTMICIQIGNKFPQEKPKVILRSAYDMQYERPLFQHLDNYPYSPGWKPEEMVKRLISNLREVIPKFQNTR